ncbi:MAG: branched-chain amino acid ABC transporter permease, partial [Desulfobacterales bacterium]|nr:branched-chain amino acid ABC transporter permease [Desulfobacterales bacterium]
MTEQTPVQIHRQQVEKKRWRNGPFALKIAILALFVLTPFLFPSFKTLDLALKIMIFAALTASFDILLGYTGILSFGHVMFFGIGSYSVALLVGKYGDPTYFNLALGFIIAVIVTAALAMLISFLSLRVKAIFFAMVTLAIAEFAIILATKLSGFTGGEDGIIMSMPGIFKTSFTAGNFLGLDITGRIVTYYTVLLVCLGLFLAMLRFIDSPLGRVLQ